MLAETKFLLRAYQIFPKKHLGQNFLVEPSIFQRMIDYAVVCNRDVVLDVGAGIGFLTRFLAGKCGRVLAVEFDARLVRVLREQLRDLVNVQVIEGDVLKVAVPEFNKVVSVPPYRISSRLFLWLLSRNFDCAVLVFQREFADRLVASVGSDAYGWLSVFAYYFVDVELLDDVPKGMFYPQPRVDSVVVRLKPKKPKPFELKDEDLFRRLVRLLFTQRNRKVRNAVLVFLKGVPSGMVVPFGDRRIRELAPEDFGVLANAFCV
ncbi:MAG: 16S rRNA (adenine(1518)-N(6)/adenine(1519)-N(6))-dimethyltransferase RsmA [Candidatus Bathyarchaeota archaeon]|nr:16S rRNA (adenine(1518)-N(6)/adenine(1519)-N(6))-dimethyltransferase RsmA [Candidatus Bathyarchaeota archaeon]